MVVLLGAVTSWAGVGSGARATVARRAAEAVALPDALGICDPIDPAACLLPFPNDYYTVADSSTDTGRRVNLSPLATPRNRAGKPIDPTEWNRQDGWSPGAALLTHVPGLDLHATWGSSLDHVQDLSWYAQPDAPIVIVNAATGERHPFWSELDSHPNTTDDKRLLIMRPAINFTEGARYIVALRNLKRADGSVIPPGVAFSDLLAGRYGGARQVQMDRVLADLRSSGIETGDLFLAWDFTVASERNLTERILTIRDKAFADLGDTDLADGVISGASPSFTVDTVTDFPTGATMRRVEGTLSVPNFLTPQVTGTVAAPDGARPRAVAVGRPAAVAGERAGGR